MITADNTRLVVIHFRSGRRVEYRIDDDDDDETGLLCMINSIGSGDRTDPFFCLEHWDFKKDGTADCYQSWLNFNAIDCIDWYE